MGHDGIPITIKNDVGFGCIRSQHLDGIRDGMGVPSNIDPAVGCYIAGFRADHRQVAAAFHRDGKPAVFIGEGCPVIRVAVNCDGYTTNRISGDVFNTAGDNRKPIFIIGFDCGIRRNNIVVLGCEAAFGRGFGTAVDINRYRCACSAG
nr:hypothetical protein [uncultured Desulfobacter sp.]